MTLFLRFLQPRVFLLGAIVFGLVLAAGSHPSLAAPGDAVGDCWAINPQTGQPVNANFVASPNNPIDCALPANTCRTKGNCEPADLIWVRWTDAIKVGDCSKPNKNGNCQVCSGALTCAVGDKYNNSNDCNNQQNKLPGIRISTLTAACK